LIGVLPKEKEKKKKKKKLDSHLSKQHQNITVQK